MSTPTTAKRVLWWGRSDSAYSRNAVLRRAFRALGFELLDFRPRVSRLGLVEAALRRLPRPDLVWVPCFRQRDVAAASRFARRHRIALCVDPLISAYDKQVGERAKLKARSAAARRLLDWERGLLALADRVVVDTGPHADYFADVLGVARSSLRVIPVGAEEDVFTAAPAAPLGDGPKVLFFGSFLRLHGPDTVARAAALIEHPRATVTLLGQGPERAACEAAAAGIDRVRFEPWVDYRQLPDRIHAAHVLLGVFGDSAKAGRVVPNKVYQSLACARPVITRRADAYPHGLEATSSPGLSFVAPATPSELACAIDALLDAPRSLDAAGRHARAIYDEWFSEVRVREALAELLAGLGLGGAPARAE